jgi:hypothetical protein
MYLVLTICGSMSMIQLYLSPLVEMTQIQNYVDEFARKSIADGLQLKETKCKELRISFSRPNKVFESITINGKNVEVVTSTKLLGLTTSNDLKWNTHISNTCKKVSTRLYFLRQLKRAKLPPNDLVLFYITCTRPVVEYACKVFHNSLPQYLSDDLEKLQKRAFRIIFLICTTKMSWRPRTFCH